MTLNQRLEDDVIATVAYPPPPGQIHSLDPGQFAVAVLQGPHPQDCPVLERGCWPRNGRGLLAVGGHSSHRSSRTGWRARRRLVADSSTVRTSRRYRDECRKGLQLPD